MLLNVDNSYIVIENWLLKAIVINLPLQISIYRPVCWFFDNNLLVSSKSFPNSMQL